MLAACLCSQVAICLFYCGFGGVKNIQHYGFAFDFLIICITIWSYFSLTLLNLIPLYHIIFTKRKVYSFLKKKLWMSMITSMHSPTHSITICSVTLPLTLTHALILSLLARSLFHSHTHSKLSLPQTKPLNCLASGINLFSCRAIYFATNPSSSAELLPFRFSQGLFFLFLLPP